MKMKKLLPILIAFLVTGFSYCQDLCQVKGGGILDLFCISHGDG